MAYTKYSLTPANNNAAPPDGAPEGMLPSAVNDTMRDMMAQIRDCGDGIRGGTYTMTAPVITGGSISGSTMSSNVITGGSINNTPIGASTANTGSFTSITDSGNLTFTGTGNRILGDFSNATHSNRVLLQTSTTNANTIFGVIPNGTSITSQINLYNNSDTTNTSGAQLSVQGTTDVRLASSVTGTGAYLPLTIYTGGSERLRIDTSGNVGIGLTTVNTKLAVATSGDQSTVSPLITAQTSSTTYGGIYTIRDGAGDQRGLIFQNYTANVGLTEKMRIDSSGNLLVGTTNASTIGGAGIKIKPSTTVSAISTVMNTAANNEAYIFFNENATNNGYRFYVTANGGIYNYSGNNSNLSDERTKTNIDLAGSYLDKICSIPVKLFNYKDEAEGTQKTLGVIAQDVEKIAPELVNNEGFGDTKKGEEPLKSIYSADMMFAMMKAIQEQQVMIEELKAKVAALEAA